MNSIFEKNKEKIMAKTLVVSYAPRVGSYTKQLLDEFMKLSEGKTEVIHLDLLNTPPDLLLADNLNLMIKWNAGQREFTEVEWSKLSNNNEILSQMLDADHIVLACPMYNLSLPATVKAWIDAIVVSDKTFSFTPEQGFKGLCGDKKALILMVSGYDYTSSSNVKEFASPALKANFDFMGISSEQISAFGVDENRDKLDSILNKAKQEISEVIEKWY